MKKDVTKKPKKKPNWFLWIGVVALIGFFLSNMKPPANQSTTPEISLEDAIAQNGSDVPEPAPVAETPAPEKPKPVAQKPSAQDALTKKLLRGRKLPDFAYLIYSDYFGCQNRETTQELVKIATQDDVEAYKKRLAQGFLSGDCVAFAPGDIVFIKDSGGFLSGTVKIRRQGETTSYWVVTEATMGK